MSQEIDLARELELAKGEIHQLAQQERYLFAEQAAGILRRLERLEHAVTELKREGKAAAAVPAPVRPPEPPAEVSHEPKVRPGRFARPDSPGNNGEGGIPAGALAMARRLADEGHSREEVGSFLDDNFRRIDVPAAVAQAFDGAPVN